MMLNSNKFFTYDVVSCSFLFDICTSYIFAKTLNFEVISQRSMKVILLSSAFI